MTKGIDQAGETPQLRTSGLTDMGWQHIQVIGSKHRQPKIMMLATDAGIFIAPATIGLGHSVTEMAVIARNAIEPLREISDTSRSSAFNRHSRHKLRAFDLSFVGGHLRLHPETELHPQTSIPDPELLSSEATASNILEGRADFFAESPELEALKEHLLAQDEQPELPKVAFVLQIPGIFAEEELSQMDATIAHHNAGQGYELKRREVDLSTALQCAISRVGRPKDRRVTSFVTTQKGPNGGLIVVTHIEGQKILVEEIQDADTPEIQSRLATRIHGEGHEGQLSYPISVIMERRLLQEA